MATKTRKQKTVHVIARIAFKNNSSIVTYLVRSSDGANVYTTTLYNGKASGCDCPAHKPCYHMTGCETLEAKRAEELAEAAAIAPIILGEQFASDLHAHIDDELNVQDVPVAVRDVEGETVHAILDGAHEVVRACNLPGLFPQGYRLVEKSDPDWQQEIARVIHFQKSDEMDEIDAERAAWARMSPDERRAAYSAAFDLSYGDAA